MLSTQNRVSKLLPALLLLAGPSALSAQVFDANDSGAYTSDSLQNMGTVTESIVGEFTGDLCADAVFLAGGQPVLAYDPGQTNLQVVFPLDTGETIEAIATWPNAHADGHDLVLAVSSTDGLVSFSVDSPVTKTVIDTQWASVKQLRVTDVNGNGEADLLGLELDGSAIRFIINPINGSGFSSSTSTAQAIETPTSFTSLRWTADPVHEFALVGPSSISIIASNGVLLDSWSQTASNSRIGSIASVAGNRDRLVHTYFSAATSIWVVRVRDELVAEQQSSLGSSPVAGIAFEDFDGDDLTDMVVLRDGDATADVYWHTNGSRTYLGGSKETLHIAGPTGGTNQSNPIAIDITNDRDADVVFFDESSEQLVWFENQDRDHENMTPGVAGDLLDWIGEVPSDPQIWQLHTSITAPSIDPGFTPNGLQIMLWEKPDLSDGFSRMAFGNHVLNYTGTGTYTIDMDFDPFDENEIRIFLMTYRVVEKNGSNDLINAGPWHNKIFSTELFYVNYYSGLAGVSTQLLRWDGPDSGDADDAIPQYFLWQGPATYNLDGRDLGPGESPGPQPADFCDDDDGTTPGNANGG